MEKSYFTHYGNEDTPSVGLRKLLFATATDESFVKKEFYWAYSRYTPILGEKIERQVEEGSLIALQNQSIEADGKQILWMDQRRGIWAADHLRPDKDPDLRFMEGPEGYTVPSYFGANFRDAYRKSGG